MFVLRFLPTDLVDRIRDWSDLKRWERKEIGQTLRRMGLSYREISAVIPVHKGTHSGWCADIPLREDRRGELLGKRGGRAVVGAKLRQRNLDRVQLIRQSAREEAITLMDDPAWVCGVVAYWAEGTKRGTQLCFANSDPELARVFVTFCRDYFDVTSDRFTVRLHFHGGQCEEELRTFWSEQLGLPIEQFRKGYVKKEGTGHRRNNLYMGTAQIRVRRSGDLRHRILGFIDALASHYGALQYNRAGR